MGEHQVMWEDFRRDTVAFRAMLQVGVEHGATRADLLRGTNVSEANLADHRYQLEPEHELTLARNLLTLIPENNTLAAEVAARVPLLSYGVLGLMLSSAPTVGVALRTGLQYFRLGNAFVDIHLVEDGDEVRLVFDIDRVPLDVRDFILERDLFGNLLMFGSIVGPDTLNAYAARSRIELAAGLGANVAAAFPPGAHIEFDCRATAAIFPRELLNEPIPQADPHVARQCVEYCEELLTERQRQPGITSLVRTYLRGEPVGVPSASDIAALLHIDVRTLHRRFAAEGTTYRQVVDEVRTAKAVELLADPDESISRIAVVLGYDEVTSFTRAFKRWQGTSPTGYRKELSRRKAFPGNRLQRPDGS